MSVKVVSIQRELLQALAISPSASFIKFLLLAFAYQLTRVTEMAL